MLARMQRNVALGPLTTLGIGGPAKFFLEARSVDEVRQAVEWAKSSGEPLLVFGGGSNMLIADAGFQGLALHLDLRGVSARDDGIVHAAATEPWDELVAMAVGRGWAGVECLSAIPASPGPT